MYTIMHQLEFMFVLSIIIHIFARLVLELYLNSDKREQKRRKKY